jgi:hypothetical protein
LCPTRSFTIAFLSFCRIPHEYLIQIRVIRGQIKKIMKYETETEILDVVRSFENGTISRDKWKHAEHLTVAFYYIKNSLSLAEAADRMRAGIFNLLKSFGIDLEKEMPYHETMTRFWIKSVYDFTKARNGYSVVETVNMVLKNFGDKDLPLRFYSRELLFSDAARGGFVKPDLEDFSK